MKNMIIRVHSAVLQVKGRILWAMIIMFVSVIILTIIMRLSAIMKRIKNLDFPFGVCEVVRCRKI